VLDILLGTPRITPSARAVETSVNRSFERRCPPAQSKEAPSLDMKPTFSYA
jgi:hypothetical protein